jgi:hypothetical protein
MGKRAGWLSFLVAGWAGRALADAGGSVPVAAPREGMNLVEIFKAGGWLMYPLAVLSIIGVALILYFLLVMRAESVAPRRWLQKVFEFLRQGQGGEARALCDRQPSPLAAVTAAALDYVASAKPLQPDLLKEIMIGEGIRHPESDPVPDGHRRHRAHDRTARHRRRHAPGL